MVLGNVKRLLESIVRIADREDNLARRRSAILETIIQLAGAASGNWSWGYGFKSAETPMPIAIICVGMSDAQKAGFAKMALAPEINCEFREPILQRMAQSQQMTTLRQDLHNDTDWPNTFMGRSLLPLGLDEWIHCVRYANEETWSNLSLYRQRGQTAFQSGDRFLVEAAMDGIPWLFASEAERLPAGIIRELTARQRATLLMQLDGMSRKQIAKGLGICEETVGDHIKQIYRHFDVNSSGELAALFLRGR